MPQRREHPYIWATWLPRLLTGENSCEWAVWFKAHHRDWTRQHSDFDQAQWLLAHTALLNERRANWEVGGYDVDIEAQNRFELRGKTATLAGRPDIIAHREDDGVIVDAKTGHESPSHAVQVMIYLYAVPKALQRYRETPSCSGQVTYRDHTVRVPADAVDENVHTEPGRTDPAGSQPTNPPDGCRRHRNAGTVILQPSIAHSALTKPPSPSAALLPTFESQPSNGRDSAWCGNRTTA